MSRTVVLYLLCAALPLAAALSHYDYREFHFLALLWIVVQVPVWACAIVLLRREPETLVRAILTLLLNVVIWGFVYEKFEGLQGVDRGSVLNLCIGFVIAAVATMLLRFGSTLVNVRTSRIEFPALIKQQFHLSQLFSIAAFVALCMPLFLYRQRHSTDPVWVIALEFLQIGSWFWIAEGLLRPRIRWVSSLILLIVLGSFWFVHLSQQPWGIVIFIMLWVPIQTLDILLPLAYRWAGWRIVPWQLVQRLRVDTKPNESSALLNDGAEFFR